MNLFVGRPNADIHMTAKERNEYLSYMKKDQKPQSGMMMTGGMQREMMMGQMGMGMMMGQHQAPMGLPKPMGM